MRDGRDTLERDVNWQNHCGKRSSKRLSSDTHGYTARDAPAVSVCATATRRKSGDVSARRPRLSCAFTPLA